MATPDAARIAQLAEQLGFESLWTGEHMVIPDPQVPPSHRAPTDPFLDPIVALTHLAATTSKIRLATGVLLIPQRHPVQLAKELASLDVLSNGRLIAGVGVGYVEAEMRAVGIDPRTRGARTNEHIAAMHQLWRAKSPQYRGRFINFSGVDAHPRPVQPGGPPLVLGGTSAAALERTVRYGDGWFGHNQTPEQASAAIAQLRRLAAAAGRDPEELEITVSPTSRGAGPATPVTSELVRAYADAGVNRLVLNAEGRDLDDIARLIGEIQPACWADALEEYDVVHAS
ncbi:MAG TPA: LLM class F420-dependent oxidoreductase [Amycolatopsis sp.]|nr:LLM class F420-dependent oxidoreductase [Amycolatopsis sp.]